MALIVAGERSGVGKTTVTLAMLAYLCRGHRVESIAAPVVQSFKVGPDYIDPMFHRFVTGRPCRNLDPILTSASYVEQCFFRHVAVSDVALIEGVMGLFDGVSGADDVGSTAHIARLLKVPIVLVLDCRRLSRSVGAIAHGFKTFDPSIQIAGWVLNQVGSDRHLTMLTEALKPLGLPIVGMIRRDSDLTLPDRHLGLVPTDELPALDAVIEQLAQLGKHCFDWDTLLPLLSTPSGAEQSEAEQQEATQSNAKVLTSSHPHSFVTVNRFYHQGEGRQGDDFTQAQRIAVARDRAFNFYYADNLERLTEFGADIVEWSPLNDDALPSDVSGLYLGGGFPEVFAAELSRNRVMRHAVKGAIAAGMPTYAECGGLMYLCEYLVDFDGQMWPMVGVLPTTVRMGKKLTLGYRRAIAQHDGPLLSKDSVVWGHEFHRSTVDDHSTTPQPMTRPYRIRGYHPENPTRSEGWSCHNLHASYVHLHWGDRPDIPKRFITQCQIWASRLSNGSNRVENK
ncbi:MAG: cobyrinate a,c-diamide synthase [Cyanobacteria bacterium J06626_14]